MDIWNSDIRDNHAWPGAICGSGGGISIVPSWSDPAKCTRAGGCNVRIFGSRIANNTANCTGGGIYAGRAGSSYYVPSVSSFIHINDTIIEGNVAWMDAGGIHQEPGAPHLFLTRSIVRDNVAERWGGGGMHVIGNTTLISTDVYDNRATQAAYAQGGGITNEGEHAHSHTCHLHVRTR